MTKVTILCEDITHERFIRQYLVCCGFDDRKITPYPNVKGKKVNNNNAYVVKNYAQIVKSYRRYKNNQDLAVVVILDADNESVSKKIKNFHKALDPEKGELNQDTRLADDKIAIFIPARNIETWFYYINTKQACDELTDYKKHKYAALTSTERINLAKASATKLATEICKTDLPKDAPASLHKACQELKRIL